MKYDFEKAFAKAVEPVGTRAFHALVKTVTDGLPSGLLDLWQTDLVSRQVTDAEAQAAAHVALQIEKEARLSILRLFLDDQFRAALIREMQTGHGRKMAKERNIRRSKIFEDALRKNPSKSTKEILNSLLTEGKLVDDGDNYLIVNFEKQRAQWEKVAKTTLDSKFSKIRKHLHIT